MIVNMDIIESILDCASMYSLVSYGTVRAIIEQYRLIEDGHLYLDECGCYHVSSKGYAYLMSLRALKN